MSEEQISTTLEKIKENVKEKFESLRELNQAQTTTPPLTFIEKQRLSEICSYTNDSYRFSASRNDQIEKEAYQILLNVLNGKNLAEQKALLTTLKIRDRKNMSFTTRDKTFVATFGFLGVIALVGAGLILGLALSLWPSAIFIGLISLWFIGCSIGLLKLRTSEFDTEVNQYSGLIPTIERFLNTLTTEHITLLTKLNSPDYQPNTKSSVSSASTKNEPTIVTPGQVEQSSTQSDPLFAQTSSSTQTSLENSHPNGNPVSHLPQDKGP